MQTQSGTSCRDLILRLLYGILRCSHFSEGKIHTKQSIIEVSIHTKNLSTILKEGGGGGGGRGKLEGLYCYHKGLLEDKLYPWSMQSMMVVVSVVCKGRQSTSGRLHTDLCGTSSTHEIHKIHTSISKCVQDCHQVSWGTQNFCVFTTSYPPTILPIALYTVILGIPYGNYGQYRIAPWDHISSPGYLAYLLSSPLIIFSVSR